jgi:hypothetical protein
MQQPTELAFIAVIAIAFPGQLASWVAQGASRFFGRLAVVEQLSA